MPTQLRARDAMQFINEQTPRRSSGSSSGWSTGARIRRSRPTATRTGRSSTCRQTAAVLDLGCGTGVVTCAIAAREGFVGTVTGIDQSLDFIAAAHRLTADEGVADRVEFVLGGVHELALPAARLDAAVAPILVSHVRDPLAVLAEAARVVRPGGSVAIFDGDYASPTFGSADPRLGERWSARRSRRS